MKILKNFIFAVIFFNLTANYGAAQTGSRNKIRERKPPQIERDDNAAARVKTIAEGADASVTTPFVFVARDGETLKLLKKFVPNLSVGAIDFERTAIVAAFAGTRNTGGYALEIAELGGKISVKIVAPPADAMTIQVITTPYKIALVAIEPESGLDLKLSADFTRATQAFRTTSGKFESSGGINGMRKKFDAAGAISVLRFGDYATFVFDLKGTGKNAARRLNETVSGAISAGGKVSVARVEARDFIDRPHSSLAATGSVSRSKLVLNFAGKTDALAADGFAGNGKLEAKTVK